MIFGLFIVFKIPPIKCHSPVVWQYFPEPISDGRSNEPQPPASEDGKSVQLVVPVAERNQFPIADYE